MLDSWGIIQYNQSCCSGQVTPDAKREGFGPVVQLVRTLACHARGRRFEPDPGRQFAAIAQQVERILGKDEVPGPNPGSSSRRHLTKVGCFLFCLE